MNKINRFSRYVLLIYGLGWLLGGLIYMYAGVVAPVVYVPSIHYTAASAVQFMQVLQPYWVYYVVAFIIFTCADSAMMLLGLVFRDLFGLNFRTDVAAFCIFAGGFTGVIIDLSLLTCWILIGTFNLSPELIHAQWSVFLVLQYLGVILSAWGFLIGAVGIYFIYKESQAAENVSNAWRKWTALVFWLCILNALAIVFALVSNDDGPVAVLFLFFTVVAAPAWSFVLALKR